MLNQEIVRHPFVDVQEKPYLCSTVVPITSGWDNVPVEDRTKKRTWHGERHAPAILPPPYAEGFFLWVAMSARPLMEPGTNHPESNCTWDD